MRARLNGNYKRHVTDWFPCSVVQLCERILIQQTLDYPCAVYPVCGSSVQHPSLFYFCRPIEILNMCEPSLEFQLLHFKSDLGKFSKLEGCRALLRELKCSKVNENRKLQTLKAFYFPPYFEFNVF